MTTATLATDSVASLPPSRQPAWLPRALAQHARWPFPSGLPRGHVPVPVPPAQRPVQPAPAAPPAPALDVPGIQGQSAHSRTPGTAAQAARQDVTPRQMVVDVLLVAMWGALIPGLMWWGAAMGF